MANEITTKITQIEPGRILVQGYDLSELIGQVSYAAMVFLLFTGRLPTSAEGRMLDAILVSSIDHGVDAPSTHIARTAASCGVPVQAAIGAGITAIGEYHGGAGEQCARIFQEAAAGNPDTAPGELAQALIADLKAQGQRMPGYGHRVHNPDPRAQGLLTLADQLGLSGRHVALARALEHALDDASVRSLPLNVDGAIAAVLLDLGIDWRFGKALFIIARTAGLAAHVHEQMAEGKPLKFAAPVNAAYAGPEPRQLPEAKG
jgi:citrate synthase